MLQTFKPSSKSKKRFIQGFSPVNVMAVVPQQTIQPQVMLQSSGSVSNGERKDLLTDHIPGNRYQSIEVLSPKNYFPRDIYGILMAPYYLTKWQVYCSMEVFWPRLLKNIAYLKDQVTSKPIMLKPFEEKDDSKDKDTENEGYADNITKYDLVLRAWENLRGDVITNKNNQKQMLEDIIDAYGKGVSIQEINYEMVDGEILPWSTNYINAYKYTINAADQTIYLVDGTTPDPDKFIMSIYRNRSTTNRTALGVYQSLAWLWAVQIFVMDYWGQSIQKFGMPFRTVTYPHNADAAFKQQLADLMDDFGSSGFAVFPTGCEFQVIESSISGKENPHKDFIDYCNTTADIIMLGNTLTTEVGKTGGAYSTAKVHENKEENIVSNLTDYVIDTLNEQFVNAVLRANGMSLDNKPEFYVSVEKDLEALQKKLGVIQQYRMLGFDVEADEVIAEAEEYGIVLTKAQIVQTPNNPLSNNENPLNNTTQKDQSSDETQKKDKQDNEETEK